MTGAQLRRARHLYAVIVRNACLSDLSGVTLRACCLKAMERKLYLTLAVKDVRFALLRKFWRIEGGSSCGGRIFDWHGWYQINGFIPHHWERELKAVA